MRALLLCFFTIFIIESSAYNKNEKAKVYLMKNNNKNDQIGLKSIQRRYVNVNTKKPNGAKDYTVFPPDYHGGKLGIEVSNGPSLQQDLSLTDVPKIRVKKVLPEFWSISRKKRSATDNESLAKSPQNSKSVKSVGETKRKGKSSSVQEAGKVVGVGASANSTGKKHGRSGSRSHKKDKKDKKNKKSARSKNSPSKKGKESKSSKHNETRSHKKGSKRSGKHSSKGAKGTGGRRLIAAREATIEAYPYVVSIQKDGQHWCSGALLNQRLVITTANCVWKANRQSRMKVRACTRSLDSGGQVVRIAEVMKHPRWSIRKSPDNDIALLLTDGYIRFSHSCHAVDLPNRVMMPVFDDAWVTSWGTERRDGVYVNRQPSTLQVYHARLIDRKECNNVTMRFGVLVTENFICIEQIGRRAPCTRDTGAPAVSDGVLWGLASWGLRKACGTERFPAMFSYTASSKNMDFIMNATRLLMAEQRLSPFLDRFQPQQVMNQRAKEDDATAKPTKINKES